MTNPYLFFYLKLIKYMRGNKLPIKEALIDLVMSRKLGKIKRAQFTCDSCHKNNLIPLEGESKTIFDCGYCKITNYLTQYEII